MVGAGAPVEVVSFGAGDRDLVLIVTIDLSALQSRPEVEVEHFSTLTTFSSELAFLVGDLRSTPFDGPAAGAGELPGVAVPVASGAGEEVAVCSGVASGVGASAVGACVAVSVGAWVAVSAGVSAGIVAVTSGAAVSAGAVAITVGVLSGELVAPGPARARPRPGWRRRPPQRPAR